MLVKVQPGKQLHRGNSVNPFVGGDILDLPDDEAALHIADKTVESLVAVEEVKAPKK